MGTLENDTVKLHYRPYKQGIAQKEYIVNILEGHIEDHNLITAIDNRSLDDLEPRHFGGYVDDLKNGSLKVVVYID